MNAKELGAQLVNPVIVPLPGGGLDVRTNCLTKRELAAFVAMQGLLSDSEAFPTAARVAKQSLTETGYSVIASLAVAHADALLAELAKNQP